MPRPRERSLIYMIPALYPYRKNPTVWTHHISQWEIQDPVQHNITIPYTRNFHACKISIFAWSNCFFLSFPPKNDFSQKKHRLPTFTKLSKNMVRKKRLLVGKKTQFGRVKTPFQKHKCVYTFLTRQTCSVGKLFATKKMHLVWFFPWTKKCGFRKCGFKPYFMGIFPYIALA